MDERKVEAKKRGSSLREDPYGRPYIDAGENTEAFVERVLRDLKAWRDIRKGVIPPLPLDIGAI